MSWRKVKLGEILKSRETRFKPNSKEINGLKRIDKIDFSGNIFISNKPSNTDMILVKKGDLVISGINVEKGAMSVYQGEEDITATIHYSSYEFNIEKIDIEFLKFFLKSKEFKKALKEQVTGGIKTEIKPKHILPLLVYIPTTLEEQKEIINNLRAKNSKIEALSKEISHQLSLVKKLRQQFLQDAVQGKLVEQDFNDEPANVLLEKIKAEKAQLISQKKLKKDKELPSIKADEIPFEIPENWDWCRLGEISLYSEAGKSLKCDERKIEENEWGIVKVSAVSWDMFLENENKFLSKNTPEDIKSQIKTGDFLISRANTSELVGKSVVVKEISKNLLLSDKIIRFNFSGKINIDYLNLCNNSKNARIYYAENGSGSSPSMKNITREHMNNLLIPLPPLAEQQRIVSKVESLMKICNDLEQNIKNNQQYTEQLMQVALKEALTKPDLPEKKISDLVNSNNTLKPNS